jgi:pyruvate/2-oxoglutarate dehydrogenase complex dihydrolipoamide dehydrogenase (E3) component
MTPIAWYDPTNGAVSADKDSPLFTPLGQVLPLYPEGEWVGLTEEEIKAHWAQLWHDINQMKFASNDAPQKETVIFIFAKAIEQRLKEKNT